MCGILFHLSPNKPCIQDSTQPPPSSSEPQHHLESLIKARGPDSYHTITRAITSSSPSPAPSGQTFTATFSASVLALRGIVAVHQPLADESTGSILMWNGEAWKFRDQVITQYDTQVVFDALLEAVGSVLVQRGGKGEDELRGLAVRDVLLQITGPYAFLFFHGPSQRVFYGRDRVGRRSLLRSRTGDGEVLVASVSDADPGQNWEEVPNGGVFEIDLSQAAGASEPERSFIPWTSSQNSVSFLNTTLGIPQNHFMPSGQTVDELETRLQQSVLLRTILTAPWLDSSTEHNQFAVLFSGGIDCTLLAYMLDRTLPPEYTIDLLNVAFENPRVVAAAAQRKVTDIEKPYSVYDECPDRKTGLSSYGELCMVCPMRNWQFVSVNVPYTETVAQKSTVTKLMYPHNTEMDLSISLALFFASRGQGLLELDGAPKAYTTKAKVLFSGLGADEIFAGYTRHAKAFSYHGLKGLLEELDLDVGRLAQRNLGRDDRVISHWSREIRYPYLDEELMNWALSLPIWEKCGFGRPAETIASTLDPGKLVLRMLGAKVGLMSAASEKKRAIQFGAKTAKMEVGRTRGTDAIAS